MPRFPLPRRALAAVALAGCGTGTASHLPNPLTLPGAAIGMAVENSVYQARRDRTKAHVSANLAALETQIAAGGGPTLTRAMDLAKIAPTNRAALVARLGQDIARYKGNPEALTVALMVHGG